MIGRRVRHWAGVVGTVEAWEPLGAGLCDAKVKRDDGSLCWYGSGDLSPTDGGGPLPSRHEAREVARLQTLEFLKQARAKLIADFNVPWPGMEFAKAIDGKAIDGAIKDLTR